MIPTDRFFDGQAEVAYEGKLYSRIHPIIQTPGKYNLHFKFISTNSEYEQCIGISMCQFKGTAKLDGNKVKLGKGEFTGLKLSEKTAPERFDVELTVVGGAVCIYNSVYGWLADVKNYTPWVLPAMIVEKNGENSYIFHCNDYVYDDDFDDLVFSLVVTKLE